MKKDIKIGNIIIPGGVLPELHELEVANILTAFGKDIDFYK